ncbi:MAG: type I-E CRISPR-associated protein Cse2/CasB [Magnetococcales bacterium]|nr:type I-E CRISPR-associated protein Cse2/CasB [Magnetococcales bacterium]
MSQGPFTNAGSTVLFNWWQGLKHDTGGRARLRRCHTLTEVTLEPCYQSLYHHLMLLPEVKEFRERLRERLPAIAALAAMIVSIPEHGQPIAKQMAQRIGDRKRVSEPRFQRLLQCHEPEEIFQSLRRILPLLDQQVDLLGLANGIYYWNDRLRKEWAYAYFET